MPTQRASVKAGRLVSVLRVLLLVTAVCTYLLDPEDVIWRLIKSNSDSRILEHIGFGVAAAALCSSLALEVRATARVRARKSSSAGSAILQNLLRVAGLGSLLPLAGFLLLFSGEWIISIALDRYEKRPASEIGRTSMKDTSNATPISAAILGSSATGTAPWRISVRRSLGLWCACTSMIIFSIVLVDRVADVLFAISGLASLLTFVRSYWSKRSRHIAS